MFLLFEPRSRLVLDRWTLKIQNAWIVEKDLTSQPRKNIQTMTNAFHSAISKTLDLTNTPVDFGHDILTFAYGRLCKAHEAGSRS